MAQRVESGLVGRINRYVEERRRSPKGEATSFNRMFSERLPPSPRTAVHSGGRTLQTGHNMALRSGASLKHITTVQAKRLAGYAPIIQEASKRYRVPVELICAVILQESGGNMGAVSHCGARGLMQLMPATAKRLGVANSFDPVQNIMGGTKYLRMLLDRFNGNLALAVAGYNAGEGNIEKYGMRIPPFKETRAYVPNVLKYADTLWAILRSPVRRITHASTIHHRTIY